MSPPSNLHGIHAVDSLLALPRGVKRIIAVLADASLCILTVWLSICLRYESWVSPSGYQWLAMLLALALALPLLAAFGFYNSVVRYAGKQMIQTALRAIGLYALMYSAIVTAFGLPTVPRTIGLLQPVLLLIGLGLVRLLAHQIFNEQVSHLNPPNPTSTVLIYGAGNSGQQLAASLQANGQTRVAGFLDDNISLHKARIAGITVHAPSDLHNLVKKHQVKDLLLAMPNLERPRRNEIIK
ncbi:MAG: polysaccharide biosynthesis protein, partial [Burkholderiales bacterium]